MDWDALLARKYDVLQQQADAQQLSAQAQMRNAGVNEGQLGINQQTANANNAQTNLKTSLMPGESQAQIAEAMARSNLFNTQAQYVPVDSLSMAQLRAAQATGAYAQAGLDNAQAGSVSFPDRWNYQAGTIKPFVGAGRVAPIGAPKPVAPIAGLPVPTRNPTSGGVPGVKTISMPQAKSVTDQPLPVGSPWAPEPAKLNW